MSTHHLVYIIKMATSSHWPGKSYLREQSWCVSMLPGHFRQFTSVLFLSWSSAVHRQGQCSGKNPINLSWLLLLGSEQLMSLLAFGLLCFLHSSISHSVLSEMQVIEQETPLSAKSSRSQLDLFDDVGTFASGPPK